MHILHTHGHPDKFGKHDELPYARLYRAERLADYWAQPLNGPRWTDGDDHLRGDDPVLGLYTNHQARALPWWIMKNHHVANLAFDDLPVLVTLCEMCSGAAAFRPVVDRRRLMFRLRGQYNATILLEDDSTHSLWSPFTGAALAGPLRGAMLERLPLWQCLWHEWRTLHPTSLVLYGEQSLREGHGCEYSPGSPGIGPGFRRSLAHPVDERLPHNTLVLGVENGASARAYPLQRLAQIGPTLNDAIGGTQIVIRCRPGTLHALAFYRRVGERVLSFAASATGEVYDEETRSVWNDMGEAIAGPLIGAQLQYFKSGVEEWYAFAAYHPGAGIFEERDA
jgi:hypothetical protein